MAKPKLPFKRKGDRKSFLDSIVNNLKRCRQWLVDLTFNPDYVWTSGCFLLLAEIVLCIGIVQRVPYTEIDWTTYMQQVELFLNGTRNYTLIGGDTGPIAYPAGHLYVFALLYKITDYGVNIKLAQYIFVGFYIVNLAIVLRIYQNCRKVPPAVLIFTSCVSYRVHSIFLLRLFNDPLATGAFYCATLLLINRRFMAACIIYSFAVSIKMNILLFAPALFSILLAEGGYIWTLAHLLVCAVVQLLLSAPFLLHDPFGYMNRAFNLGRVFLYKWTVNWRFLPEHVFTDRRLHLSLLIGHLVVLLIFGFMFWLRRQGGLRSVLLRWRGSKPSLSPNDIVFALFTANFIGVMFSRSLHYQFYIWYYHTLPYLMWSTNYTVVLRLTIMGVMEYCWNTYPSTSASSALLHLCHIAILFGLWQCGRSDAEKPVVSKVRVVKEGKFD